MNYEQNTNHSDTFSLQLLTSLNNLSINALQSFKTAGNKSEQRLLDESTENNSILWMIWPKTLHNKYVLHFLVTHWGKSFTGRCSAVLASFFFRLCPSRGIYSIFPLWAKRMWLPGGKGLTLGSGVGPIGRGSSWPGPEEQKMHEYKYNYDNSPPIRMCTVNGQNVLIQKLALMSYVVM